MEEIKQILVKNKEKGIPSDLLDRKLKFDYLKKKANVFVGIRRSGKTYSLYQLMKKMDLQNVFYLNMEDDRIINPNLRHLTNLVPAIEETFEVDKPIYLFIDEIQNVENWDKWARRMAESEEVFLFLSGSSSKLTSFEIRTILRGRTLTNYVFPLSFKEFLIFKNFDYNLKTLEHSSKKPAMKRLLREYLEFGGFPEIVLEEDKARKLKLLREYFTTIISRDIIERHRIENLLALETFMKYMIHNYSRSMSFSKTQKWMSSLGIKVGKATLMEYFNYIKQSFFVYPTSIFSYKIKDVLQYPLKVYLADTGFVTALTIRQKDLSWIYENKVAEELFKEKEGNPAYEIHYWKNQEGYEVDFVVKEGARVRQLIQVCLDLNDKKTRKRELRGLIKASQELKCRNLLVITKEYEKEEKKEGRKIKFLPLWKYLLLKPIGNVKG